MRKSALTRIGIEVLLLVLSVLAFFALGGWWFLFGQSNMIPPDIPSATDFRCAVDPIPKGWRVTATVIYVNPTKHHGGTPWQIVLAEYKNKNRKKARASAEKSCNEWLDAVDRVRAEVMPVDGKRR